MVLQARRTGLEPVTYGVTGRCCNQLNYRPKSVCLIVKEWAQQGLNLRPSACKADALPLSYTPLGTVCLQGVGEVAF